MTLKEQAKQLFESYVEVLSERWEIDDWFWVGDEFSVLCIGDIFLGVENVMLCVDEDVPYEAFAKWYEYDLDMHYGIDLGKKNAQTIHLKAWLMGFPEELKVSPKERQEWNNEYWYKSMKDVK